MMKILALDASTERCSAALSWAGEQRSLSEICPRSHSQRLPEMVGQLLDDAGITLADLDLLAVGRGPGGFTGVRIGIGYAMGLALASGKPIIGVSSLAALARQAWLQGRRGALFTALDARMGEVYLGCWQLDEQGCHEQHPPLVAAPAQLAALAVAGPALLVGSAGPVYGPALQQLAQPLTLDEALLLPEASAMLALAEQAWQAGDDGQLAALQPLYLRNNVVSVGAARVCPE